MQRQLTATGGVKVEPALEKRQTMENLADEFMEKEGLKKETGWELVQTDEESYSKLRYAIRTGDTRNIQKQMDGLRKSRTDGEIAKSMKAWSVRPFTKSKKAERMFLYSLDDKQLENYSLAQEERYLIYEKFLDALVNSP
jgi:hypothetical protein